MALAVAITAARLYGQSAPAPQFEVAVIRPSKADTGSSSGIRTRNGRMDGYNVTLKRCIMGAYGVGPHQVTGGPSWVESERYEISAKAEQPLGDSELMLMLQGLLADRFKLTLHRETRVMPAYVLEVTKDGPKLEKAEPGEASTNTSSSNGGVTIDARRTSLNAFAEKLARRLDLPVVNQTGIDGIFNMKLSWTPESSRPPDPAAQAPSIFTAIQEQLGLRLHSKKTPVETLVIDHVEKPSEN